jgi:hypothetical protein
MKKFDSKTEIEIGAYVYCLIDPRNDKPFYIGKGVGNRVFAHVEDAEFLSDETDKLDTIREIGRLGLQVGHVIIRHGLDEKTAYEIESALIDLSKYIDLPIKNEVLGHHSGVNGIMTVEELERKYTAKPLEYIEDSCIIININKKYQRAKNIESIYDATKGYWVISKNKIPFIKYVLAEYRGFIVAVFEVDENGWYTQPDEKGKLRWGFNGKEANEYIKNKYLNRAVRKKRGAANPISYKITL